MESLEYIPPRDLTWCYSPPPRPVHTMGLSSPSFSLAFYPSKGRRRILAYGSSIDDLKPLFDYYVARFPQFRYDVLPVLF